MAWASLLSGFAKGASKKAKKKGADMAKNITNKKEKDNSSAIVVREKSTTLAPMFGGGGALDTPIQKPTTKGSPLDRIDSALLDIMNTLKSRRKLMLNKSRQNRVQADKEKKGKREGILEKMKEKGKKMVGDVAAGAKGWWEKLQRFLLMTLLGSLVMAIKDNWEAIKVQIDKVVNIIKGIWEFMSPVLIPLFQALKWITVQGFKLIGKLLEMGKDKKQIEKGTDEISEGLKKIDKEKSKLTGLFEKSKNDTEKLKDEDHTKDFKSLEETESKDEENPGEDIGEVKQKMEDVRDKVGEIKLDIPKFEKGASPVPETGPAIVHKGEVIIPAPVVKRAGGVMNIENMVNMMQSSSESNNIKTMMQSSIKNIQQNPLKIISIMEGMSKEFAPMGEQIPDMINETIKESKLGTVSKKITREMVEKMEKTLTVLKEQTEYEDPSGSTVFIPVPTPSQPPMGGGGSSGETTVIMGESGKAALNRYVNAVIQKALY